MGSRADLFVECAEAGYADANGDGSVDTRDAIAIGINWHYTHSSSAQSYEISPDEAQAHRATLKRCCALHYSPAPRLPCWK